MSGPVSPATRQKLIDAMHRLLTGSPNHTDGKLTKNNLCREAQVSRATMSRAGDILAEWDARISDNPAAATARRRDENSTAYSNSSRRATPDAASSRSKSMLRPRSSPPSPPRTQAYAAKSVSRSVIPLLRTPRPADGTS
jgi:hypothetical protein